jgi:hypothetical protein
MAADQRQALQRQMEEQKALMAEAAMVCHTLPYYTIHYTTLLNMYSNLIIFRTQFE